MERSKDWLKQAEFDLKTAKALITNESYSWVCFIAHQAAEKGLKALLEFKDTPTWGHDLLDLVDVLNSLVIISDPVMEACARLNLYYIPTRYPDAFSSGAPAEKFTLLQAKNALKDTEEVLSFVKRKITKSSKDS